MLFQTTVVQTLLCVVYERVSEEIKSWIWEQAPGVRESLGCPKKEVLETFPPSMRAPQEGCKCGQELGESTNNDSGINRIRGGEKMTRLTGRRKKMIDGKWHYNCKTTLGFM